MVDIIYNTIMKIPIAEKDRMPRLGQLKVWGSVCTDVVFSSAAARKSYDSDVKPNGTVRDPESRNARSESSICSRPLGTLSAVVCL